MDHARVLAPGRALAVRWTAPLVALLPLQFALLRFGPPDGAADIAGVVLTIVQWLLIGRALRSD